MMNIVIVVCSLRFLVLLVIILPMDMSVAVTAHDDDVSNKSVDTSLGDLWLSGNVSWWAESVSLALGDVATRALGYDQLQQLYDNSVCMTSLTPDDVNISQHVLDAAATFSQFNLIASRVDNVWNSLPESVVFTSLSLVCF